MSSRSRRPRRNPKKDTDHNGRTIFRPDNAPQKYFYSEAKAVAFEGKGGSKKTVPTKASSKSGLTPAVRKLRKKIDELRAHEAWLGSDESEDEGDVLVHAEGMLEALKLKEKLSKAELAALGEPSHYWSTMRVELTGPLSWALSDKDLRWLGTSAKEALQKRTQQRKKEAAILRKARKQRSAAEKLVARGKTHQLPPEEEAWLQKLEAQGEDTSLLRGMGVYYDQTIADWESPTAKFGRKKRTKRKKAPSKGKKPSKNPRGW